MQKVFSPIHYRDFWDVPRVIMIQYRGKWFLFDCAFDEEVEDYPDSYKASLIAPPTPDELAGSWEDLPKRAYQSLGEVPIVRVEFDPTKRQSINAAVLEELTTAVGAK
jgi:hypothetical protein